LAIKNDVGFFQQLIIKPGSTSFELWESLPIPMYMKLYYYNITNGDEIEARIPGKQGHVITSKKCMRKQDWLRPVSRLL
jgi:hypothetical protein